MQLLHALAARVRLLFARRDAEARMNEEMRFHLEMETQRIAREARISTDEARRRALIAFGGVDRFQEEMRDGRGLAWLGGLRLDLRLGLRMLARSPGLTLVGVLGLAVAVAIGTISYVLIYSFIGTTLPVDEGDRVVAIENVDARRGVEGNATHLHDLDDWRTALRAVEDLGAFRTVDRNVLSAGARPDPMRIAEMTPSGFRIARVAPMAGRYLHDDDARPGAPPVAVIGHEVWRNRFGSAPDVVGRQLQLGATAHTIVGIMPEGFAFPVNNRVWTPLRLDPHAFARGEAPALQVFGRLAPGASLDDAQAQAATIGARLAAAHPASHEHVKTRVMPYTLAFFDSPELAWVLHLAQALVSMLLVVIGTNVAVLVYARTARRAGEIAVRTALGASRARIVSQLFAEALVLALVAAAVGLGGAVYTLWHLRAWAKRTVGEQVPYWMDLGLTPGAILYVAGLAVLAAVIVGVVPALKATGRDVRVGLQQLGTGGAGMRLGRSWTLLIVAQVAVAVTLLPAVLYALLLQRSAPFAGQPTYAAAEFVTARVTLDRDGTRAQTAAHDSAFAAQHAARMRELVRRLEADPRVTAVTLATATPGDEPSVRLEVEGVRARALAPGAEGVRTPTAQVNEVDLAFFGALEVPLLAGRALRAEDAIPSSTAIVVNESFVRRVLGGGDALGRRVRRSTVGREGEPAVGGETPWLEIVGVVANFPTSRDAATVQPRLYEPLVPGAAHGLARRSVLRRLVSSTRPTALERAQPLTILARVRAESPARYGQLIREVAVAVDPMLRVDAVHPLAELLEADVTDRVVFYAVALVALSVLALSAAGIYALVSFTIARRRREIGIRAALGAGPRRVLVGILSGAAAQVSAGIALGLVLGGALLMGMEGGAGDGRGALVLAAVAALMAAVGLGAAFGPARRALRIPPTEALRAE